MKQIMAWLQTYSVNLYVNYSIVFKVHIAHGGYIGGGGFGVGIIQSFWSNVVSQVYCDW